MPILVVVIAIAVVAAVWRLRPDASAIPGTASAPISASQDGSSSVDESPSAPGSDASSSADTRTTSAAAADALDSCRDKVEAGDEVIKAAAVGIGHWSEHVQAQTDRFDGKISAEKLSSIFARTRVAGPDDLRRYDDATDAWDEADGACDDRDDASTADRAQLESCSERLSALKPVMAAAADGMGDWKQHLADMRHSRMDHVADAEKIWLDAWKAAPPHIEAFDRAEKTYEDAPDC